MARKGSSPAPDVPLSGDAPTDTPAVAPPLHVADAGALFQKDRSGDPRSQSDSEGKANFASFSALIQADHAPEPKEAA